MTWTLILGLTLPSVVVLVAVYLMFKQYFQHQTRVLAFDSRREKANLTLPLRLQAYERLTLLCERIYLPDLILRLKTPGTHADVFKSALILAIQQEYEHNLTQQLYISEELWNILQVAKNKTMDLIVLAGEGLSADADADDFARALFERASAEKSLPSEIAKKAIKTESALWL